MKPEKDFRQITINNFFPCVIALFIPISLTGVFFTLIGLLSEVQWILLIAASIDFLFLYLYRKDIVSLSISNCNPPVVRKWFPRETVQLKLDDIKILTGSRRWVCVRKIDLGKLPHLHRHGLAFLIKAPETPVLLVFSRAKFEAFCRFAKCRKEIIPQEI